MSGLESLRDTLGKPVAIVAISGAALVTGMATLWLASTEQPGNARGALQPSCIALAIDRDSGTTSTRPCAGTPVLVAGKETVAK
ncbi:MAG: hypothetical protein NW223_03220 [Hyphomicrobiaceae bacterium]|nr:hypothetical protein [Hyphomicrobiaceae bacterium]